MSVYSTNLTIQHCLEYPDPFVKHVGALFQQMFMAHQDLKAKYADQAAGIRDLENNVQQLEKESEQTKKFRENQESLSQAHQESERQNRKMTRVLDVLKSRLISACEKLGIATNDEPILDLANMVISFACKQKSRIQRMDDKSERQEKEIRRLTELTKNLTREISALKTELENAQLKLDRTVKGNSETTNFPSPFDVCAKSRTVSSDNMSESESRQEMGKETQNQNESATDREIEKQKSISRKPTSSKKKTGRPRGRQTGDRTDHRKGLISNPDYIKTKYVTAAPRGAVKVTDEDGQTYYAVQVSDVELVNTVIETRYFIDRNGEKLPDEELDCFRISRFVYTSKVKSLCLFLLFYCRVPYHRVAETLSSMTRSKVVLSEGTIAKWAEQFSTRSKLPKQETLERILKEDVLYADETGIKISGKQYWLHVLASDTEAFYVVTKSRGDKENGPVGILMKAGYKGTLVTDHFASYQALKDLVHAECNVHIERYMRNGETFDECAACTEMLELYEEARSLKNEKMAQGVTGLNSDQYSVFKSRFLRICQDGIDTWEKVLNSVEDPARLKPYTPPYYTTFLRMKKAPDDYLRFLSDFRVSFGNNRAEQLIQKAKSKMKISKQCVTEAGAEIVADSLSLLETARTGKKDVLELITGLIS